MGRESYDTDLTDVASPLAGDAGVGGKPRRYWQAIGAIERYLNLMPMGRPAGRPYRAQLAPKLTHTPYSLRLQLTKP